MFLLNVILLWKKSTGCKYDSMAGIRLRANPTLMRCVKTVTFLLLLSIQLPAWSQDEEFSKEPTITVFTGLINYQGDLNPNSFTIGHSKFAAGFSIRKPLNRWFSARAGFNIGHLEAADRYNRNYLKSRNLSFFSTIKEAYAGLEVSFLDISKSRFTPYMFGGVAVFHFNPWTYDNAGKKTYLRPLSTEGEGLAQFPSQKPYNLTQFALPFGVGVKYAVNDNINIGFEFSQRKTFTDYLDDVSSFYVDHDALLAAKGSKAVELAYRGIGGSSASAPYPQHGEQRGTPSEMDWYYFAGLNLELKLNAVSNLFNGFGSHDKNYRQRCPRRFL
jgi:opacity protein-like surface antigen